MITRTSRERPRLRPGFAAWLMLGLILASFVSTLLWNAERSVFGKIKTTSWDTLINSTAAVGNMFATAGFLIATYYLLRETQRSNQLTRDLTLKLHADALTPFISVTDMQHDIRLSSRTNETLIVRSVECGKRPALVVNESINMSPNELRLRGKVVIGIANFAEAASDTLVRLAVSGEQQVASMVLAPQQHASREFYISASFTQCCDVEYLFDPGCELRVEVTANGPGASAEEVLGVTAKVALNVGGGATVIDPSLWQVTRHRDYGNIVE
jgi:hypothetical protein